MLIPNKHSHPDETVLAVATDVLRQLRKRQIVTFDDLKRHVSKTGSSDYLFIPALSLLFLLGLVEYQSTVDSFVYTGARA